MMQLMFALAVQQLARSPVEIEGYDLPEWGLTKPSSLSSDSSTPTVGDATARALMLARLIDRYRPTQIDLSYLIQRASNYLPKGAYEGWFPSSRGEGIELSENELLIHVRLGDVKTFSHPMYGPLPVSYYRYLTSLTGLTPVFIGEIDTCEYCTLLRQTFRNAKFLPTGSIRDDFQTMRRARHIALAVSSFSWVAAYLSDAQRVHMPICGWFDYRECPDIDMLPHGDERFIFHDIPATVWQNRYSDFQGRGADFSPLSTFEVGARRIAAEMKVLHRRGKIRWGLERRLLSKRIVGGSWSDWART
jgi:hypothetical protein